MLGVHLPSEDETRKAAAARKALDELELCDNTTEIRARFDHVEVSLPRAIFETLLEILKYTQKGHAVTLLPIHAELTTQQAAALLNVSRPHVIRLLEDGKIPFHMVGTHRRIRASDLLQYKAKLAVETREAADALTAQAQELGFDY